MPLLPGVRDMAVAGHVTGASGRNWTSYGAEVVLSQGFARADRDLLADPQTSGGLLVSCTRESVDAVLAIFRAGGFEQAAVIGHVETGAARLVVR